MTEQVALGWLGIVRLGLVQTALGAVVVLTTSTINRVMVVELALPAMRSGHCWSRCITACRFCGRAWGYGSDVGGRRTPWIVGGMAVLGDRRRRGRGRRGADAPSNLVAGLALALHRLSCWSASASGAAGTSLLVLLAKRVAPGRARAPPRRSSGS